MKTALLLLAIARSSYAGLTSGGIETSLRGTAVSFSSATITGANCAAGETAFSVAGSTFVVKCSGKVGIGTNVPSDTLDVIGNVSATTTYPYFKLASTGWPASSVFQSNVTQSGGANGNYVILSNPAGKGFAVLAGASPLFTVTSTGPAVGIGTTDPYSTLSNKSTGVDDAITGERTFGIGWTAGQLGPVLTVYNSLDSAVANGALIKSAATSGGAGGYLLHLMSNAAASGGTSRFFVGLNGLAGINNQAPTTALTVYGVITSSTTQPAIVCNAGTPVKTPATTDQHGTFLAGIAAVNCTVTFGTAYPKIPVCLAGTDLAVPVALSTTESTSALVITGAAALTGANIKYHCFAAP